MPLSPGTRLGPCQIVAPLGAGGMGEVHRARDPRLGRDVAIEALFEVPPSPTETAFRDYDYDPRTDRFLFTRTPRGVAERREIAVSLGWAGRLEAQMRGPKAGGR